MLSVDGDAGIAGEARVWKGWNKFRQKRTSACHSYDREVIWKLFAELYVIWQWNSAGEEREQVGTL